MQTQPLFEVMEIHKKANHLDVDIQYMDGEEGFVNNIDRKEFE